MKDPGACSPPLRPTGHGTWPWTKPSSKRWAAVTHHPTLRLYAWEPACLSLGYAQPLTDVDIPRLQARGWEMVRRPTGGRAILHTDELTYPLSLHSLSRVWPGQFSNPTAAWQRLWWRHYACSTCQWKYMNTNRVRERAKRPTRSVSKSRPPLRLPLEERNWSAQRRPAARRASSNTVPCR